MTKRLWPWPRVTAVAWQTTPTTADCRGVLHTPGVSGGVVLKRKPIVHAVPSPFQCLGVGLLRGQGVTGRPGSGIGIGGEFPPQPRERTVVQ